MDKVDKALNALKVEDATGGHAAIGPAADRDEHDYPPCNACGKEFEGKLHCSKCQCVFYCGRECQRADWKNHKKDCDTMAQSCKDAATKFVISVTSFVDLSFDSNDADESRAWKILWKNVMLNYDMWRGLGNSGAYKHAIDLDINGAIESLFKDDIQNYGEKTDMSFTELVMGALFRRKIPGSKFSEMDAYRIKKYIRSSPKAFETWVQSSLYIIDKFQTRAVNAAQHYDPNFEAIQNTAGNIASAWNLVFASPKACKAILLGSSKVADKAATGRAKWILGQIFSIIDEFPDDDSTENATIRGHFLIFTALVELRVEEFGIDIGSLANVLFLELEGYDDFAVPLAMAIIAKGKWLTPLEHDEALKKHAQSVRSQRTRTSNGVGGGTGGASAVSAGRGKKKGKKKGKKGRRK